MNKRTIGTQKEELAAEFLKKQGVSILERNFFTRQGEIDLIGIHQDTLVFFEVKYRKKEYSGLPQEAVNYNKQRQICKVSLFFLNKYHYGIDCKIRYDVVAILGNQIEWFQNAFDYIGK